VETKHDTINGNLATQKDKLTLIVLKDNLVSRSFKIPFSWINKLGWILSFWLLITICLAAFGFYYYTKLQKAEPSQTAALEENLNNLKRSYEELEIKYNTATKENEPTDPETVAQNIASMSALFPKALFPENISVQSEDIQIPIRITKESVEWKDQNLSVDFILEYYFQDNKSQQGRIFILAYSESSLHVYPENTINASKKPSIIDIRKGEFFSVSRFRTTHAEIGPFNTTKSITNIKVIILGTDNKIILIKDLKPPTPKKAKEIKNEHNS